jgi:serine/threonine protein kinase
MEELVIGHYRVTHKIGEGGMAEVYAAKHELMDRYAAVKLLLPEMSARKEVVRRFFQEAQAAACIEHPGIVQVFDVGYTGSGRAYLVMEMLSGEPLNRRLKRQGRLSLERTIILIRQLAGMIGAAHQRGIIHRDLKPDNLFLVPDPEMPLGERVKVLDFGLAKLLESMHSIIERTTQDAVFGTPAYMAPEQCQSTANVDGRADLYAIGCIFYACLCGQPPFGSGGLEVLLAHLSETPVSPRQRASDVPPEIDALILRLLEKDPAQRLSSCEALIAEIDRVLLATPELARAVAGRHDRLVAGHEPTIRDDPTLKGAVAAVAGLEQAAQPLTGGDTCEDSMSRLPSAANLAVAPTQRLQARVCEALPTTRPLRAPARGPSPAIGNLLAPAHVPVEQRSLPVAGGPGAMTQANPETSDSTPPPRGSTPTIGNGELEGLQGRNGSRRILWSLAASGFLGALMVTGLVLGAGEEEAPVLGAAVLAPAIDEARTDTAARQPLQDAPVIARPLREIDYLIETAQRHISNRAWSAALATLRAAAKHDDLNPERRARVRDLAQRVRREQRHQSSFEQLRAADGKRRLQKMADAYAAIPEDSAYHAEARTLYEAARDDWLRETRVRIERLRDQGDCSTLARVVAEAARVVPGARGELEAQSVGCVQAAPGGAAIATSTSAETPAQLLALVRADQAGGMSERAADRCRKAWELVARNESLALQCGIAECKVENGQTARWHYLRITKAQHRRAIANACREEGIELEE